MIKHEHNACMQVKAYRYIQFYI